MARSRWMPLIMKSSLRRLCWLAPLLVTVLTARPVRAQTDDMFPTKAAALERAKELKCTGAFAMGKEWMPCKDIETYDQAVHKRS